MKSSNKIWIDDNWKEHPTVPVVQMECYDADIENAVYGKLLKNSTVKAISDKDEINKNNIAKGKRIFDKKKKHGMKKEF